MQPRPARALVALVLASATFSISITSVVPALPAISTDLGVSVAAGTWAFTGYLLASAALTPSIGHLGDVLGHRRVLLWVLVLFAGGAVFSGVSDNLTLLIVGRALQGTGGAIIPLCFGIVRTSYADHARVRGIALISATNGLGTGLGLLAGGIVVSVTGFRGVFVLSAVLAIGSWAAIASQVQSDTRPRTTAKLDIVGASLLTLGLVSLLAGVSQFEPTAQGAALLAALSLAAIVALWILHRHSRHVERSIVDLRQNLQRPVSAVHTITFLSAAGGFTIFLLTPVLAQRPPSGGGLGLSELATGAMLFPGCLLMMAAGAAYPRMAPVIGARGCLTSSSSTIAAGLFICMAAPSFLPTQIVGIYIVLAGIGLHLSAAAAFLVNHVPASLVSEANAVNALSRNVGNAVGAQACTISLALVIPAVATLDGRMSLLYVAPFVLAIFGTIACLRLLR